MGRCSIKTTRLHYEICPQCCSRRPHTSKHKKATSWCIGSCNAWCDAQGLPSNLLQTASAAELNEHLKHFILEANRQDGCPSSTRFTLSTSSGNPETLERDRLISILDSKNLDFFQSRQVLDARMKDLTSKGLGQSRSKQSH